MNNITLELFNAVIVEHITNKISHIDLNRGLILYDNIAVDDIPATLTGQQLNASFHKSMLKVAKTPTLLLQLEQLAHYITSYSSQFSDEISAYIPTESLNIPELTPKLEFRKIRGITKDEVVSRILNLLTRPTPLKSETISDFVNLLRYCGHVFTGSEEIANSEARVVFFDIANMLPTLDLFRFVFYKCSTSTLVINSAESKALIAKTGYDLTNLNLSTSHLHTLAQSFNRHKQIWLNIKKANPANVGVVNKISKLSKKNHKPLEQSAIKSYTSQRTSLSASDISSAPTSHLIGLLNAIGEYSQAYPRVYKIRNGKAWANLNQPTAQSPDPDLVATLKLELASRIRYSGKVYIPPHTKIALPKSEKDFVGSIPNGTTFEIEPDKTVMVGVHWFDNESRVDLDLKGFALAGTVGWNADYVNDEMIFSGDIVEAPPPFGAAEWLYTRVKPFTEILTLVTLNKYHAEGKVNFSLILAKSDRHELPEDYIADHNEVLLEIPLEFGDSAGMSLGLISRSPGDTTVKFTFTSSGINNARVSNAKVTNEFKSAFYNKLTNCVFLNEILSLKSDIELVDVPGEGVLDLSLSNLSKSTLLELV